MGKVPIELADDKVTLLIEGEGVTLSRPLFDQLFRVVGLRGEANRMLSWDCGCTKAGTVDVHAGFLFEAADNEWNLATAAREYQIRANSMPDVFPSGSHHRLLEGLYHTAQQLVDENELSVHPFARKR